MRDPRMPPMLPPPNPSLPAREGALQVLCGWHAVEAALQRRPEACRKLLHSEARLPGLKPYLRRLAERRVAYRVAGEAELLKVAGTSAHQGVVAAFERPVLRAVNGATLRRWASQPGLTVALDGVANPHNLGALARTAAFFGLQAMLVGEQGASGLLSTAAYRVAEGGLDRIELALAADLVWASEQFRRFGGQVLALDVRGSRDLRELRGAASRGGVLLIVGAEENGVSAAVCQAANCAVHIAAGRGAQLESLNVGVATGIAIAELTDAGPT